MRRLLPFVLVSACIALVLFLYWNLGYIEGDLAYVVEAKFHMSNIESEYAYFYILGATVLFPLLLSFDKKVYYAGKWKYLSAPFLLVSLPYIVWDVFFTNWQIWGFNEDYISAYALWGLPLEEVLFFFIVPFACVFIYECVRAYRLSVYIGQFSKWLIRVLAFCSVVVIVLYFDRFYSFSAGLIAIGMIAYIEARMDAERRNDMYTAIILSFIPFLLINGLLTGIASHQPIVVYNMSENMGVRFFSIPVDDFIYQMGMLAAVYLSYSITKMKSVEL